MLKLLNNMVVVSFKKVGCCTRVFPNTIKKPSLATSLSLNFKHHHYLILVLDHLVQCVQIFQ